MNLLNGLSLLLELVTAGLGVWIAVGKKKVYGWLIALTFAIYVVYDLSRFMKVTLRLHNLLFFAASASVCLAVWLVVKE